MVTQGTVVQESYNEEEEILLSRNLMTSLGSVQKKSCDIAVWGRSWGSAVLGQFGTVQS